MALLLTFTYFKALLESLGIEPSGAAILELKTFSVQLSQGKEL